MIAVSINKSYSFSFRNNIAGVSDSCRNKGITHFTTLLSNWSGSPGYCMYALLLQLYNDLCSQFKLFKYDHHLTSIIFFSEIGNGAWDSWTMPFLKQVNRFS